MDVGQAKLVVNGLQLVVILGVLVAVLLPTPRRRVNIVLALALGAYVANDACAIVFYWPTASAYIHANAVFWSIVTNLLIPICYLAFLGAGLDTPLVRPLRRQGAFVAYGLGAVLVATALAFPSLVFGGYTSQRPFGDGPLASTSDALNLLAGAFSLVASIHARSRTLVGSAARRRANAYLAAFAGIDAVNVLVGASDLLLADYPEWLDVAYILVILGCMLLLARGILREQLFDIDLKLKAGLRRSFLGAAFLAVFFVVAQLVQAFSSALFGLVGGAVAAGLLLFALRPLERVAATLADAAMPRVEPTPSYVAFKKLEVYQAALEGALQGDRQLTERERGTLDRLRHTLGIHPDDAAAMERDALAAG